MADVEAAPENEGGEDGFFGLRVRAAEGGGDFLVVADGGEDGFGDFASVLAAEFFVGAEVGGNGGIGGLAEGEDFGRERGGVFELCGVHGGCGGRE